MHVGGCNSIYAIRVLRERRVHTGCVSNPFFLLSAQSLTSSFYPLFIPSIILLLFTLTIFRICFFFFYFCSFLLFYLFHLFFSVSLRPHFSFFFHLLHSISVFYFFCGWFSSFRIYRSFLSNFF